MSDLSEKKMRRCCDEEAVSARREEILETATELFAEHGFSDAITQVLADRLQIGKGTLYRHFPSKRALFLAATDRVMVKLNERVEASVAGVDDGLERVARAIATYLRFFAENPQFVELLIQERANFKDRKRPTYFEHRERTIERWRQLYRDLIAAGRVRPMAVEQITEVISGAIYGTMFINYFTGQTKPSEIQAQEIVDVAFHGILTESERRRQRHGGGGSGGGVLRHEAATAPFPVVDGSVRGAK
jgi:AcrR family transcriptional regulator